MTRVPHGMETPLPNINTLWARLTADELARGGVRRVVHAPGSRSTPLVAAFARYPDITLHAALDERSAAFFALGLAKGGGTPVVLLCTSGTAAANLFPAVCEADLSEVPLLVLTADRPAHLQHTGAPQTMDQSQLFGSHVRLFHDMSEPAADEEQLRALRAMLCHALHRCMDRPRGPVHLNFPFHKPLEETPAVEGPGAIPAHVRVDVSAALRGRAHGAPWVKIVRAGTPAQDAVTDVLEDAIRRHERILVFAGPDADGAAYRESLARLSAVARIPVCAEATSQQRFTRAHEGTVLTATALLARDTRYRALAAPDLVLHLGAAPTTKALQELTSAFAGTEWFVLSPSPLRHDPTSRAQTVLRADPARVLEALAVRFITRPRAVCDDAWLHALTEIDRAAEAALHDTLSTLTEPFAGSAVRHVVEALGEGTAVMVSSSMPIRDLETYTRATGVSLDVFFNRGVNGIDGVTSTALGITRARGARSVLITGDIALLHDTNALLLARDEAVPLTVVVLNNDGGEIFGMLPIRNFEPVFTEHFVRPHGMDLGALAAAYGIPYTRVESSGAIAAALTAATGTHIVEVRTDLRRSLALRGDIERAVIEAVSPLLETYAGRAHAAPHTRAPLAWRCMRAPHSGGAIPVVLLHGFTRSGASWRDVAATLPADRSVYALDLPGHGQSPIHETHALITIEDCITGIQEFLDRRGIARVHLVGYSLGGRVALRYTLAHPGHVETLTLISAAAGLEDAAERSRRAAADEALASSLLDRGLEQFLEDWSTQPILARGPAADARAEPDARRDRYTGSAHGYAAVLRGLGQGVLPHVWPQLPSLGLPVLLVAGEHDTQYRAHADRMAALLPRATRRDIPGAGHDVPGDTPCELARALADFWPIDTR